jgi:hypothetical protein
MYKLTFLLFLSLQVVGCRNSATSEAAFTGNIRMTTPFTQPSVHDGRLYLSNGRLRVELGALVLVYIVSKHSGWEMFPQLKQYIDIGEKQVSTYLPPLINGSPCPHSDRPAECRMLGKYTVGGRQATKWSAVNQHGEPVYLWTDDQLGIALRLEIENVMYEVSSIHQTKVANSMFELPAGYTQAPESWRKSFGSNPQ